MTQYQHEDDEDILDLGTCQGCGSYGTLGKMCIRNGEECGEYV